MVEGLGEVLGEGLVVGVIVTLGVGLGLSRERLMASVGVVTMFVSKLQAAIRASVRPLTVAPVLRETA